MRFHKTLNVFADYFQFYLWDSGASPLAPEDYTDDDLANRVKLAPNTILVPELPGLPVQFCCMPAHLETAVHDIVIHGHEPSLEEEPRRSIISNAFRANFPNATVALTVSDSAGFTHLLAPSTVPPVAVAAAAAIAKAVGSWEKGWE